MSGSVLAAPAPRAPRPSSLFTSSVAAMATSPFAIAVARTTADPAGHHARPDVNRLLLNSSPLRRVVPMDEL